MKLKSLFRFPEILLPLSILLGPQVVINKTIDIQLHDTYFVFGGSSSWGIVFFALIVTWVFHVIVRQEKLFSDQLRWVQVSITVICWLAILAMLVVPYANWIFVQGLYHNYSDFRWIESPGGVAARLAVLIVFILNQLIFWIIATIKILARPSSPSSE